MLQDGKLDEARFNEPSGLWIAGKKMYIADASNNCVREVDMETGYTKTMELKGIPKGLGCYGGVCTFDY